MIWLPAIDGSDMISRWAAESLRRHRIYSQPPGSENPRSARKGLHKASHWWRTSSHQPLDRYKCLTIDRPRSRGRRKLGVDAVEDATYRLR